MKVRETCTSLVNCDSTMCCERNKRARNSFALRAFDKIEFQNANEFATRVTFFRRVLFKQYISRIRYMNERANQEIKVNNYERQRYRILDRDKTERQAEYYNYITKQTFTNWCKEEKEGMREYNWNNNNKKTICDSYD